MPVYCYKCAHCGASRTELRPISRRKESVPCGICGADQMTRDLPAEQVNSTDMEYDKPILSDSMGVHPSQVASQHMYLRREGHYRPTRPCNLPWVPYLLDLSGEAGVLEKHRTALAESPSERVPFLGGTIDFTGHVSEQTDWTAQQMSRLEEALFGEVRPAVRGYIEALRRHERKGR